MQLLLVLVTTFLGGQFGINTALTGHIKDLLTAHNNC